MAENLPAARPQNSAVERPAVAAPAVVDGFSSAAVAVSAWAETLSENGAGLPELARALRRPLPDVHRMWEFAAGRASWLQTMEGMAANFAHTCPSPEIAQGLRRKAVVVSLAHLTAAAMVGLATTPWTQSFGPVVALGEVLGPCITLPFAVAWRRHPSSGFACLAAHSITTGFMLHGVATLSVVLLQRPLVAESPLLSSFPVAVCMGLGLLVASMFVTMFLATVYHGSKHGLTPDDFMALALGASGSLQSVACFIAVCFVMRSHMPVLTAEALRSSYYSFLTLMSVVAAGAWAMSARPKEEFQAGVPMKEFRCLVDQTPFGLRIMLTREGIQGIRVNVIRGSAAERAGVLPGDILIEVAGQPVFGPASNTPASREAAFDRTRALFMRPGPFAIKLRRS